jgi:hypothetical protein
MTDSPVVERMMYAVHDPELHGVGTEIVRCRACGKPWPCARGQAFLDMAASAARKAQDHD